MARDLARGAGASDLPARMQLLERCLTDQASAVRRQALLSIADLEASGMRDQVMSLLCDADLQVRQMAVLALGEIADPSDDEVAGRLSSLLQAGFPAIRYQALLSYCNLRPRECQIDLYRALSDSDLEIKRLALRLIDEVLLARDMKLTEDTVRAIVSVTQDEDPQASLLAQLLCGELGCEATCNRLVEVVERKFRVGEPRDEQWAIELCGRLRIERAVPALRRRAYGIWGFSGDAFRWVALGALSRFGEEQALERLFKALRSGNYTNRVLAVDALGRSGQPEAWSVLDAHRFRLSQGRDRRLSDEQELVELALGNLKTELKDAI